jgi:hypothetical protein
VCYRKIAQSAVSIHRQKRYICSVHACERRCRLILTRSWAFRPLHDRTLSFDGRKIILNVCTYICMYMPFKYQSGLVRAFMVLYCRMNILFMSYYDCHYDFPLSCRQAFSLQLSLGLLNPWYLHLAELASCGAYLPCSQALDPCCFKIVLAARRQ